MNLLVPSTRPGQPAELGAAAIGLPHDFAEGLAAHKSALLEHFRAMIPALHSAFPGRRPRRGLPGSRFRVSNQTRAQVEGIEPVFAQQSRATSAIFAAATQVRGWRARHFGPNHDVSL
jgi:hypothetical protein